MMNKTWVAYGVLAALPVLGGPAASADEDFTMTRRCVIANEDCFVMRASHDGRTPEQRLDLVNDRLAYILGYEDLSPKSVRLISRGDTFDIFVGRSLLTTVTPADARAHGTRDVRGLAKTWTHNLRHALPQARPLSAGGGSTESTRLAQK